jgi:hypothetical protein
VQEQIDVLENELTRCYNKMNIDKRNMIDGYNKLLDYIDLLEKQLKSLKVKPVQFKKVDRIDNPDTKKDYEQLRKRLENINLRIQL